MIQWTLFQQFFLCPSGNNISLINDKNLLRILNSGKPVGNNHKSFAVNKTPNSLLDLSLAFGISVGSCLVQNDKV